MLDLKLKTTKVLPKTYLVSWDSANLLPDDTIYVLRSEAAYTGFEPVSPPFKAYVTDQYHDQLYELIPKPYYKLRIERGNEARIFPAEDEQGVAATMPLSSIVLQRRKHLNIAYKRSGVEVLFYKRRTVGMRCPYCVDKTTQKVLTTNCPHCFGTGYIGGFLPPVKINVLLSKDRTYDGPTSMGMVHTRATEVKIPGWIEPKRGDIIRDPVNTLWEITDKISVALFQRGAVQYTALAVEVEPNSVMYELQIPEQPIALKFTVKAAPAELK